MQLTSIASGSNGNCSLIQSDRTHILVDAGVSCKRINEGLALMGVKADEISGIFLTHEHSDHIAGLKIFCSKYGVPIFGTKETLEAVAGTDKDHRIDPGLYRPILPDGAVSIGDLSVTPFSITHDAANPVGYRVDHGEHSVGVCTDLGNYTPYTVDHLRGVEALLLEANHDIRMLEVGPYPFSLKRRILSDYGHLSNEASGRLLSELLHNGMRDVLLGHLSEENNYPELALEAVKVEIDLSDTPYHSDDFRIRVAGRFGMSETIRTA